MGQAQAQMMGCCWIPDVDRQLMNIFGYTYSQAYRRVVRTSPGARDAAQGTSLSKTVFSRLVLTLGDLEGLPARPPDMRQRSRVR